MAKVYQSLPRGFFCLAAVLLVLSALAVPSRDARSDEPLPCGGPDNAECAEGYECVNGYCALLQPCFLDTTTCPDPSDPALCKGTATECFGGQCKCKQEKTACPCVKKN